MFENLTEKLQRTFKNLRGQGKLTEEHLDAALAEIREAMLEGDVAVSVVTNSLPISAPSAWCGSYASAFAGSAGHQNRSRRTCRASRQARKTAFRLAPAFRLDDRRLQAPAKPPRPANFPDGSRCTVIVRLLFPRTSTARGARTARASRQSRRHSRLAGAGTTSARIVRGAIKEAKLSRPTSFSSTPRPSAHDDELMNELSTLKKELQPSEILLSQTR